MAFQKAVPTSIGQVKGFARGSARTATWVAMGVLGLGLFAFASPFIQRIPFVGGIMRSGEQMIPGRAAAMSVDQWGRVR